MAKLIHQNRCKVRRRLQVNMVGTEVWVQATPSPFSGWMFPLSSLWDLLRGYLVGEPAKEGYYPPTARRSRVVTETLWLIPNQLPNQSKSWINLALLQQPNCAVGSGRQMHSHPGLLTFWGPKWFCSPISKCMGEGFPHTHTNFLCPKLHINFDTTYLEIASVPTGSVPQDYPLPNFRC